VAVQHLATPAIVLSTIAGASYLVFGAAHSGVATLGFLPDWTLGAWILLLAAT
jgi:hypothetical protein